MVGPYCWHLNSGGALLLYMTWPLNSGRALLLAMIWPLKYGGAGYWPLTSVGPCYWPLKSGGALLLNVDVSRFWTSMLVVISSVLTALSIPSTSSWRGHMNLVVMVIIWSSLLSSVVILPCRIWGVGREEGGGVERQSVITTNIPYNMHASATTGQQTQFKLLQSI